MPRLLASADQLLEALNVASSALSGICTVSKENRATASQVESRDSCARETDESHLALFVWPPATLPPRRSVQKSNRDTL